ncbi:MAG TPA: GNAT family N-acetyltransferase [Azospirillaceae bacterium]|nr:GNAT family N-acetyltransferase [Azospirillaceae bacterium]
MIRQAEFGDAAAIAAVHVASWRETYGGLLHDVVLAAQSVEERTARWHQILRSPDRACDNFVALAEGGIVGFASSGPCRGAGLPADSEIYAIYLLRRAQGLGLGRRLLEHCMDALWTHGHRSAGLWVLEENRGTRGFYEAMGGVPRGTKVEDGLPYRAYLWTDAGIRRRRTSP